MRFACMRLLSAALVLVVVAGCGGGSGNGGSGGGGGGNPPTTVTFTFRGPAPTAVAAKIGSGAFTAQTVTSSHLTMTVPSGTTTFAVAYVCPQFSAGLGSSTTSYQFVVEASTADGTSFTPTACPHLISADPSGTLTGNVDASALAGVSTIFVDAENGDAYVEKAVPQGNFSISAPAGTNRVEVLAYENIQINFNGGLSLVAARDFSSQPVPGQLNGGNPVVLGAADATTPQPITYNGVPSGFASPITFVLADMGAGEFLVSTGATNQYPALPAAAMETGDFYHFSAISQALSNGQVVAAEMTTKGGNAVTLTFPAPWPYAGPTAAALPSFNFDYTGFAGKTGVFQSAFVIWPTGNLVQSWYQVSSTANYQNGSTAMTIPNLSALAGFLPPPASGTKVVWAAEISQSNATVFQPIKVDTTTSVVENLGVYTVP
jgi:hypothetical protein